jgi:hypothetical protein
LGAKGIFGGAIALIIAGAIFSEGRYAASGAWVMMALIWSTWGLADIVSSRWPMLARLLRMATLLSSIIGLWFVLQLVRD